MKLINLGCGNHFHKDWLNIDFISNNELVQAHNLLQGIPLKNNSVDVVYHSHILEHFSKEDGYQFIQECYRVLKKDGIIRIAVPDLEIIVKEYLKKLQLAFEGDKDAVHDYNWIKIELLDQMVRNKSGGEMAKYLYQSTIPNEQYVMERIGLEGRKIRNDYLKRQRDITSSSKKPLYKTSRGKIIKNFIKKLTTKFLLKTKLREPVPNQEVLRIGRFRLSGEVHQWMYDRYSLKRLLLEIGFSEVQICSAFQSEIENWEKFELDVVGGEIRKPDSLFIEAKKQ